MPLVITRLRRSGMVPSTPIHVQKALIHPAILAVAPRDPPKKIVIITLKSRVGPINESGPRKRSSERFWGDLIRAIRVEQRMSMRRLCMMGRINMRTLRHLEGGDAYAYIGLVEKILDILGYELDAFPKGQIRSREQPPAPSPVDGALTG